MRQVVYNLADFTLLFYECKYKLFFPGNMESGKLSSCET